jgi:arsenic resistance protein ArsH
MRMLTIPNESSVPMAYKGFHEAVRMRPPAYYDRFVDVVAELVKSTLFICSRTDNLIRLPLQRMQQAGAQGGDQ